MYAESFRLLIERAFAEGDVATLNSICQRLAEATEAMSILRNKHYGAHGTSLPAMARQVEPFRPSGNADATANYSGFFVLDTSSS